MSVEPARRPAAMILIAALGVVFGDIGTSPLAALAQRRYAGGNRVAVLRVIGIVGMSLFYGDSVITPTISVLSSVEGLEIAAPGIGHLVVADRGGRADVDDDLAQGAAAGRS